MTSSSVVVANDRPKPPEMPSPVRLPRNSPTRTLPKIGNQGSAVSTGSLVVLINQGPKGLFYSHRMTRPSQAILGLLGVIQYMYLDDTHKGREAFSKGKGFLQEVETRMREALVKAMGRAPVVVNAKYARGFFAHCHYSTPG
jgi:hypothetical protein